MDLRIKKTKAAIYNAFIALRRRRPTEKIKIVELCELAEINKSTFYKHYRDIFELADEFERETIEKFWSGFAEKDLMLSDPSRFLVGLPKAADQLGDAVLTALFRGRYDVFLELLAKKLGDYYIRDGMGEAERMKIKFVISGVLQTLKEQKDSRQPDNSATADELGKIILSLRAE